jgi:single-strand DNA-binding protein
MSQGFTVNSVFLIGNLTRDPDVRFLNSGTAVAKLGLAVNNRIKRGDEWVNDPCFVDITLFGKRAEWAGGNLDKGMQVFVEGRLQFRSWETQDGQKRSKLEVVADIVKLVARDSESPSSSSREPGDDDEGEYGLSHGGRKMPRRADQEDEQVPF